MKKVFLIHGYKSSPNTSWFPWLMSELKDMKIYACSLCMPNPEKPICSDWVDEISRNINKTKVDDEIYFVGHSLGVAAILNYIQSDFATKKINGAILVSGRYENNLNIDMESFYTNFNFDIIKNKVKNFAVLHGENDDVIPHSNGVKLAEILGVELITIKNGGHLNKSSGFKTFVDILKPLNKILLEN